MSKLTIDQKRLESLRRQLYGKEKDSDFKAVKKTASKDTSSVALSDKPSNLIKENLTATTSEQNYIKKDLTKVLFLSVVAIGFQLLLYFTSLKNLLNLKIF